MRIGKEAYKGINTHIDVYIRTLYIFSPHSKDSNSLGKRNNIKLIANPEVMHIVQCLSWSHTFRSYMKLSFWVHFNCLVNIGMLEVAVTGEAKVK